jgi:hypothetical protein
VGLFDLRGALRGRARLQVEVLAAEAAAAAPRPLLDPIVTSPFAAPE